MESISSSSSPTAAAGDAAGTSLFVFFPSFFCTPVANPSRLVMDRDLDCPPERFGSLAMPVSRLDPDTPTVQQNQETAPRSATGPKPVALRTAVIGGLLWMVAGPMILFMSVGALILKADGFWTSSDGFYAAGLAAMFVGRWLEFRSGAAETADGKPVSTRDVHRYYLLLGSSGLAIWLIATAIRTFWLRH
jgi:hypothetical protein